MERGRRGLKPIVLINPVEQTPIVILDTLEEHLETIVNRVHLVTCFRES
jgi:hypothetical protein